MLNSAKKTAKTETGTLLGYIVAKGKVVGGAILYSAGVAFRFFSSFLLNLLPTLLSLAYMLPLNRVASSFFAAPRTLTDSFRWRANATKRWKEFGEKF